MKYTITRQAKPEKNHLLETIKTYSPNGDGDGLILAWAQRKSVAVTPDYVEELLRTNRQANTNDAIEDFLAKINHIIAHKMPKSPSQPIDTDRLDAGLLQACIAKNIITETLKLRDKGEDYSAARRLESLLSI